MTIMQALPISVLANTTTDEDLDDVGVERSTPIDAEPDDVLAELDEPVIGVARRIDDRVLADLDTGLDTGLDTVPDGPGVDRLDGHNGVRLARRNAYQGFGLAMTAIGLATVANLGGVPPELATVMVVSTVALVTMGLLIMAMAMVTLLRRVGQARVEQMAEVNADLAAQYRAELAGQSWHRPY